MADNWQCVGELVDWNDERGCGFIQNSNDSSRVWVHINDFKRRSPRPRVGDRLIYSVVASRRGPIAKDVQIGGDTFGRTANSRFPERPIPSRILTRIVAAIALLALILIALIAGRVPWWIFWVYVTFSAVSAASYWSDKSAAKNGQWRTPEASLHLFDSFFGIIGGLLAQAALRHKTSKPGFTEVTALIFVVHFIAWLAIMFGWFPLA
ncbi:MAG: cold shock and DUF1294 domain-containing protein [Devosia sp.]